MKKIILCTLYFVTLSLGSLAQTQSYKRGYGVDQSKFSNEAIANLSKGAGWYYDWSPSSYLDFEGANVDFVPMTWNGGYNASQLRQFLEAHPSVKYLLAFNEPNFRDQANMTPSQAVQAWRKLQQIADEYNLKLVSPAPNWCGWCVEENGTTYNSPYDWLRDFFAACPDCRVDYIGIHFYMGAMESVKGSIDLLWEQFHKPVWLTEFNMDKNGMGDNGTADEQRAFMVRMIDWMERDPHVFRYAWFLGRGGILTDLVAADKKSLTMLGQVYANMSSYDSAFYHSVNTRIEAEHYISMENLSLVPSTDTDGALSVGYTAAGSRLAYQVDVPSEGEWTLTLRTAGEQDTWCDIYTGETYLATLQIPATGSWTEWRQSVSALTLPKGKQTLGIRLTSGSCDINWLSLSNTADIEQFSTLNSQFPIHKSLRNGQLVISTPFGTYNALGQRITEK
ncbi:MAG: carbohydrate-binding protein [Paludibacteraceae bacterium]|nr:carbohydrate-binding protein [Paludibacteraceae bacterium]